MSDVFESAHNWLDGSAPAGHVVMSSRGRFARNLAAHPFAPHADAAVLERILELVAAAMAQHTDLRTFDRLDLTDLSVQDRAFLMEARLISKELERARPGSAVFVAPDRKASLLVNEEDHLRIQCFEPGLQLDKTSARLNHLEARISEVLAFAWHDRFGFLTACPTNVGTGLRASVMLHLPALTIGREAESVLSLLSERGLAVRGFYGENSGFLGDCYQISNDITLGKTPEAIVEELLATLHKIVEREEEARATLLRERRDIVEDSLWRSYGLLTNARRMNTREAMTLLSRLRLGIDIGLIRGLTHDRLNRLFLEIQPAQLARSAGVEADPDDPERDVLRAAFLRERMSGLN